MKALSIILISKTKPSHSLIWRNHRKYIGLNFILNLIGYLSLIVYSYWLQDFIYVCKDIKLDCVQDLSWFCLSLFLYTHPECCKVCPLVFSCYEWVKPCLYLFYYFQPRDLLIKGLKDYTSIFIPYSLLLINYFDFQY